MATKTNAYQLAKNQLNWEYESKKFINTIKLCMK